MDRLPDDMTRLVLASVCDTWWLWSHVNRATVRLVCRSFARTAPPIGPDDLRQSPHGAQTIRAIGTLELWVGQKAWDRERNLLRKHARRVFSYSRTIGIELGLSRTERLLESMRSWATDVVSDLGHGRGGGGLLALMGTGAHDRYLMCPRLYENRQPDTTTTKGKRQNKSGRAVVKTKHEYQGRRRKR